MARPVLLVSWALAAAQPHSEGKQLEPRKGTDAHGAPARVIPRVSAARFSRWHQVVGSSSGESEIRTTHVHPTEGLPKAAVHRTRADTTDKAFLGQELESGVIWGSQPRLPARYSLSVLSALRN